MGEEKKGKRKRNKEIRCTEVDIHWQEVNFWINQNVP